MTTRQRQHLLAYLGYYVGAIDGIWGAGSKASCRAFQEDFNGIEVTGLGSSETDKALRHAVAYDMFRVAEAADVTGNADSDDGTFWAEIKHFKREEFRCKCGGRYCNGYPHEPQEAMVRLADGAREHFGKPANIISGLRCEQHNANEGGVINSQHIYGEACDIQIPGVSAADLLAWFKNQPGVRYAYAINGTNVHFDIPKGAR